MRDFSPRTGKKKVLPKKIELVKLIRPKIENLEALQNRCRGKQLSIDVTFYLYDGTEVEGRTRKDLDNMLKIVMDILPERIAPQARARGLGLCEQVSDESIFEVHGVKKLVNDEKAEGLDLEVSEWIDRD